MKEFEETLMVFINFNIFFLKRDKKKINFCKVHLLYIMKIEQ